MPRDRLTPKQRQLLKEVEALAERFSLDYENIMDFDREGRTHYLRAMKDKLIRSQIIIWYTLVDEFLCMALVHHFFGRKKSTIALWHTKRFKAFNYYLLEEMFLLKKLEYVRSFKKIPPAIERTIRSLNTIRNGIAHALFPENLKKSKPIYRQKSIYTPDGIAVLDEDMQAVINYCLKL
jgi:hypothetical protein